LARGNLLALPYPSETGYRSHFFFLSQVARLTVREAAEAAMMEFIGKRCRIERNPRLEAKTREYTALPWVIPGGIGQTGNVAEITVV
jgi:hypothetical protein